MPIAWSVAAVAALIGGAAQVPPDGSVFELGVVEVVGVADDERKPAKPEVVDAEDLRRNVRRDVAEAVERLPGVAIQNIGQRSERLVY
ncbi:MAG TPA: hypothetical protein VM847_03450, partial [Tahibacter sp.]|nr:hypothetical protein [Tahibacter sp.]